MKKQWLIFGFLIMCLFQWYVPAKMVFDNQLNLERGTAYHFKTIPVDPSDPLRGKYILLRFDAERIPLEDPADWNPGEVVYAILTKNADGYAKVARISREEPGDDGDYFTCMLQSIPDSSKDMAILHFPFDRYYMKEGKAKEAEELYRRLMADGQAEIYARVFVHQGRTTLEDVQIGGESLKDLVSED